MLDSFSNKGIFEGARLMGYHKVLIDNTVCSRRFHVTYDDRNPKLASVELKCPYCDIVIFSAVNHPPAQLARQENLVQTAELSDNMITECHFRDAMTGRSVYDSPQMKGGADT